MGEMPTGPSGFARILVIEDDPDIRDVIRMHLEKEQFAVATPRAACRAWPSRRVSRALS